MTNKSVILYMPQRSDDWHIARSGSITASAIESIQQPRARETYINKLLAEMLTGEKEPFVMNAAIQRGIDFEQAARERYIKESGNSVKEVGFVYSDESRRIGCSPDGLVGDDGLVEFKCPNSSTHISYRRDNSVPKKYVLQIQHQLYVTGRQWCDFMSWDDRIENEESQIFLRRINRCAATIAQIEHNCKLTLQSVDKFLKEEGIVWQRQQFSRDWSTPT